MGWKGETRLIVVKSREERKLIAHGDVTGVKKRDYFSIEAFLITHIMHQSSSCMGIEYLPE